MLFPFKLFFLHHPELVKDVNNDDDDDDDGNSPTETLYEGNPAYTCTHTTKQCGVKL